MYYFMRFPQGKAKAVTLSYDDFETGEGVYCIRPGETIRGNH